MQVTEPKAARTGFQRTAAGKSIRATGTLPVTAELEAGDVEDRESQRHGGAGEQLLAERHIEPGHL